MSCQIAEETPLDVLLGWIAVELRLAIANRDQAIMRAALEIIDAHADLLAPAIVATIPATARES